MMDPQAKLTLINSVISVGKTVFDIAQGTSKMEEKAALMDVYDQLMELKRSAGDLEDENRDLKQKLRFKSDDFDFKNPLWYEKGHPDRALCPTCYSKQVLAPMAAPYNDGSSVYRRCLTCDKIIHLRANPATQSALIEPDYPEEWK